jgi:hypothetical protein
MIMGDLLFRFQLQHMKSLNDNFELHEFNYRSAE